MARRNDQPLAAILTLCHKNTLTYKYGASDAAYNSLGGVQLVHWSAIRDAKAAGLQVYDLGRSDVEQSGLITFKDRWGAKQSTLTYSRFALTEDLRRKFAGFEGEVGPSARHSGPSAETCGRAPGTNAIQARGLMRSR